MLFFNIRFTNVNSTTSYRKYQRDQLFYWVYFFFFFFFFCNQVASVAMKRKIMRFQWQKPSTIWGTEIGHWQSPRLGSKFVKSNYCSQRDAQRNRGELSILFFLTQVCHSDTYSLGSISPSSYAETETWIFSNLYGQLQRKKETNFNLFCHAKLQRMIINKSKKPLFYLSF